ncbi:TetR/AcrR family transcriptional regulator [Streptomyces sp. NPDC058001]|uniref:TetR/AcrR family transcriptional regulator n=1 Tax=Streptomyces sp. NPDC058001 TaxID=3346300 RepID=UPI0036F02B80
MAERRTLDGARARDREVIEVATRIFWEKGYSGTSVREVADALGMLKGSLYYYIDSKEDLLERIFQDSHDEVRAIATETLTLPGPATQRLRTFLVRLAEWYLTNTRRASLYAREWRHASDRLREVMLEQRKYYDKVLLQLVEEAAEEGGITPDDAKFAGNFVMSAISSLPDWYRPGGTRSPQTVAAAYADMAMRLLGAAGDAVDLDVPGTVVAE